MIQPPRHAQPVTDHTAPNKPEFNHGASRPRSLKDLDVIPITQKHRTKDISNPTLETDLWKDKTSPNQGSFLPNEEGLHMVSVIELIEHKPQNKRSATSSDGININDNKTTSFQRFYIKLTYLVEVDHKGLPKIVGVVKNDKTGGKNNQKSYAYTSYNKSYDMYDTEMVVFENGLIRVTGLESNIPITLAPKFKKTQAGYTLQFKRCDLVFNAKADTLKQTVISEFESRGSRRSRRSPQPLPRQPQRTTQEIVRGFKRVTDGEKRVKAKKTPSTPSQPKPKITQKPQITSKPQKEPEKPEDAYFKQIDELLRENPFYYKQLSPQRSRFFAMDVEPFDLSQFEAPKPEFDWAKTVKVLFGEPFTALTWTKRTVNGFGMDRLAVHHNALIQQGNKHLTLITQERLDRHIVDVYGQNGVYILVLRDLFDPFEVIQVRLWAEGSVLNDVDVSQVNDIITFNFHNKINKDKVTFCYRPQHNDLIENSNHDAFLKTVAQGKPVSIQPRQRMLNRRPRVQKRMRLRTFQTRRNAVFKR